MSESGTAAVASPIPGAPKTSSASGAALAVRTRRIALAWARGLVYAVLFVLGTCALWELAKVVTGTNDNLMPHTWSIAQELGETASRDTTWFSYLAKNMLVTGRNAVVGLIAGAAVGLVIGILIARNRIIGAALMPLTTLMQTIPIVAIAPALVLFLGSGWVTKAFIAAFLTFFPVSVATAKGIGQTSVESLELMRVCASSGWQTLLKMQLPSALPMVFVGLETAAGMAVIGAIVAELPFGGREGLGAAILQSWQFYTFQPEPLYLSAVASCLLGAAVVFAVRAVRSLIPAAGDQKESGR